MGGLQLLYNEKTRFTGPMKRVGARGSDTFQAISWDDALDILAERISGLRDNGKIGALAAIDGNLCGSTISVMIETVSQGARKPELYEDPVITGYRQHAAYILTGRKVPFAYDLENAITY